MKGLTRLIAAFAALTAASLPTAEASTFVAWQVKGVSFGDTLTVRKFPANGSQKRAAYPNGTVLSMTGRCTGGVDLQAIQNQPDAVQRQKVRYRWCEVWHDPKHNEEFETGWVYGRYIAPY